MFGALGSNRVLTTVFRAVDMLTPAMRTIAQQAERTRAAVTAATNARVGSAADGVYRDMGGRYTNSLFSGMIGGVYRGARGFSSALRQAISTATLGAVSPTAGGMNPVALASNFTGTLYRAAAAAAGGWAVSQMVQAHSQFEETSNAIAGMLSALGVSGSFTQGLQDSADVMNAIAVAAARLPGEAEDYIAVFRAGLPFVQGALPGGSLEDIYTFTNRLTAIGSTLGVQSDLIGRDIADMLAAGRGRASIARTQVFAAMLPFMKQVQGQANLTAESFNRMTAPQRAQLLQQTFAKLDPMLRNAERQFSAISGALASTSRMLLRMSTGEVFNAVKDVMESMNSLLADSQGRLTPFGAKVVGLARIIGREFGQALGWVARQITALPQTLDRVSSVIMANPRIQQLGHIAARVVGYASRAISTPAGQRAAGAIALSATGPLGAVLAPLVAFGAHTSAVNTTLRAVLSVFNRLVGTGEVLFNAFAIINETIGGILAGILPGLASGLAMIVAPLLDFTAGLIASAGYYSTMIQPYVVGLAAAIGQLFQSVGEVLAPLLRALGAVVLYIVDVLLTYLAPAFNVLLSVITWVVRQLARRFAWIGRGLNSVVPASFGTDTAGRDAGRNILDSIRDVMNRASAAAETERARSTAARAQARQTPEQRGGHVTNFNNNRFDITQKFAEGYDPDRIAVAFVEDINRAATRVLHSGFSPLYGIR